jgi:hypothetical protein
MTLQPHRLPLDAPPVGRVIATYNAYHLGDNLLSLHFLRALAKAHPALTFVHGAPENYLPQLAPLTADLKNLSVVSMGPALRSAAGTAEALNLWIGHNGFFYGQPDRHDFVAVYLRFFARTAFLLGLPSPFTTARDLLFDYPALYDLPVKITGTEERVLVINSAPQSGQFRSYDPISFDRLVQDLRYAGHIVVTTAPSLYASFCTQDTGMDITAIGRLSQTATAIIGVPTGPIWPTFNIWNADTIKLRLLLLDTEQVNILPQSTVHANSLALVPEILAERGLL